MSEWIDTCRGRDLIRDAVQSAAWDHEYDPWGSGMLALGVLTDAAFFLGVPVDSDIASPGAGQFRGGEWIRHEEFEQARHIVEAIEEGQASVADLEHGIRWVNRYLDLPAVAARRY